MATPKFELTITADNIISTDTAFSKDNLEEGDHFIPINVFFVAADKTKIFRKRAKGERKISNRTLPFLAFQIFETQIAALPPEEKKQFPICQYSPNTTFFKGIFSSEEEYKQYRNTNTLEMLTYSDNGQKFVIYCWNIFSTLQFVQECLIRFGEKGACFKLIYQKKEQKDKTENNTENIMAKDLVPQNNMYLNPYSQELLVSKNIIFRGAPGTGKTYLAKEIAADIVSNGSIKKYAELSADQKKQIEFVQFHPSYDYSDFVEGLRPIVNGDGSMGFELQDGVFKAFADRARKNFENSQKSKEIITQEVSVQNAMEEFFSEIELGKTELETLNHSKFFIEEIEDKIIKIFIPDNPSIKNLTLNIDEIKKMLESKKIFNQVKDVRAFFDKKYNRQEYSYLFTICNEILKKNSLSSETMKKSLSSETIKQEELKSYVFIIDEINRGEISKIFGELFFAIDPGYRGRAGEVSTQYSNMHALSDDKFYIPKNVYIIGTMNDIDRSVDSFDFAMRRRFRFIELKADGRLEILDNLDDERREEAIKRMKALNKAIMETEGLNENYQIGAAYFRKLETLTSEQLWTDSLCPLLQDYINGMYGEVDIMKKFKNAYNLVSETGNLM